MQVANLASGIPEQKTRSGRKGRPKDMPSGWFHCRLCEVLSLGPSRKLYEYILEVFTRGEEETLIPWRQPPLAKGHHK